MLGVPAAAVGVAIEVATVRTRDAAPPWLVVGLVVAVALSLLYARRAGRLREASREALSTGVPRAVWDGPQPEPPRLLARPVSVGLFVLAPLVLVLSGLYGLHVQSARDAAPHVAATVVSHDPDGYTITVALGRSDFGGADERFDIDSYDSAGYPVGSTQQVVVQGDQATLVVEGYDASWGLATAVGLTLVGAALRVGAQRAERDLAALFTTPQPVFRARFAAFGDAQVLPLDGPATGAPLVGIPVVAHGLDAQDDGGDDDLLSGGTLFGPPVRGAMAAIRLDTGRVLLPVGRVGRPDPAWAAFGPDALASEEQDEDVWLADQVQRPTETEAEQLQDRLTRPERWRYPVGVLVLVGALLGGFFLVREADGLGSALWRAGLLASFSYRGVSAVTGQIRLEAEHLVIASPAARRLVPWSLVRRVTVVEGVVLLVLRNDDTVALTGLPRRPFLSRRRASWANDWAAVLAREVERSAPAEGAQLEKQPRSWLAVVAVLYTVAVVLGLVLQP